MLYLMIFFSVSWTIEKLSSANVIDLDIFFLNLIFSELYIASFKTQLREKVMKKF